MSTQVDRKLGSVLFTRDQIGERVRALAAELSRDWAGKNPLLLIVLKGAAIFGADLARAMDIPVELDYLPATSYRGTWSTGAVSIGPLKPRDIYSRNVIIIEDIHDSGTTLSALVGHVQDLGPQSLTVCTLFDKQKPRAVDPPVQPEYVGFEIPDQFIVGYGMDLDERFRQLPDVHTLQ